MTNRDNYKRAFQTLRPSDDFSMEGIDMKRSNMHFSMPRAFVAAILIAILAVGTLTAFAADLGGIRQAVDIWINGNKQDAIIEFDSKATNEDGEPLSGYTLTWQDEDGELHEQSGGGVAIEADGTERPFTLEEYIEDLNSPMVEMTDANRIIASWYDQAEDITDRFEDGRCKVALTHDGQTVYLIVNREDNSLGFTSGFDGFEALEAELAVQARLEALFGIGE